MPIRPKGGDMSKHHTVSEVSRKDMRARLDDPYRHRRKHPDNTRCPECGLVFLEGAWKRVEPRVARPVRLTPCPACLQTRHDYPSGVVTLKGSFVAGHRAEILSRVRNVEAMVQGEHPLERIYRIVEEKDELILYSTGEHLAARVGKALRRDFQGELKTTYAPDGHFAAVRWTREE
jgi:hypothetical protein